MKIEIVFSVVDPKENERAKDLAVYFNEFIEIIFFRFYHLVIFKYYAVV